MDDIDSIQFWYKEFVFVRVLESAKFILKIEKIKLVLLPWGDWSVEEPALEDAAAVDWGWEDRTGTVKLPNGLLVM